MICTGSRVRGLPQAGLELNKTTVISSDEALVLEKAPKRIAIVGAGAVGCEFADVFAAFGSKVTLIEALPRILPLEDEDASAEVQRSFKKRGMDVIPGAKLTSAKIGKDSVTLTLEAQGAKQEIVVDRVLVATGRAANVENIGLKEAGVAAHRPRLHQDQRADGDEREGTLRDRRRRRPADARAQGRARGHDRRRGHRGKARSTR